MAWIDAAQLDAQLNELIAQEQRFVTETAREANKGFEVDKFLYWLIEQRKTEAANALSQEAQTRTLNDTGLSNRIDALANTMGTYKATLIYELTASDSTGTTSLQDLFAAGMAARNLTVIPNAEYRIIFSQKDSVDEIVEKTVTYVNFANEASTGLANPAEAFILKTDANGAVANGAIQENPFKRELDLLKLVQSKIIAAQVSLGAILKLGADGLIELGGRVNAKLSEWAGLHGYIFPNL